MMDRQSESLPFLRADGAPRQAVASDSGAAKLAIIEQRRLIDSAVTSLQASSTYTEHRALSEAHAHVEIETKPLTSQGTGQTPGLDVDAVLPNLGYSSTPATAAVTPESDDTSSGALLPAQGGVVRRRGVDSVSSHPQAVDAGAIHIGPSSPQMKSSDATSCCCCCVIA